MNCAGTIIGGTSLAFIGGPGTARCSFDRLEKRLLRSSFALRSHRNRPRRLAWPRTSPFHGGNTGSNPVGDAKSFQKFKSAAVFFAGTARMKSFVVAPSDSPGQQTFAHQRSVIFWSQPSLPMWVS